jgi:hypothetical protein
MIRAAITPGICAAMRAAIGIRFGAQLHPDTKAWMVREAAGGFTVSASQLAAADWGLAAINAAGLRTLVKRLNFFFGTTSGAACVPQINEWGAAADTAHTSPTYTEARGFTGNGTSQSIRTGLTPSTQSGWTVLDHHHFVFATVGCSTSSNRCLSGAWSNAGSFRYGLRFASTGAINAYCGPTSEIALAAAGFATGHLSGWLGVNNLSSPSALSTLYRNSASIATDTAFSTDSKPSAETYILGAGGTVEWSDAIAGAYSIGLGMTAAQEAALRLIIEQVMVLAGRMDAQMAAGDSIAAPGSSDWQSYLMTTDLPRRTSDNIAVGGETASQTTGRLVTNLASATSRRRWKWTISTGRNDIGSGATFTRAQADTLLAEIATQRALIGHDRVWYMQPLPGENTAEYIGGAKRDAMQYLWDSMFALLGTRYIELLPQLLAANNGDANDLLDVSRGIVPRSLRSDAYHPTTGAGGAHNLVIRPAIALKVAA